MIYRATPFRVELCSNLAEMGYQVFALDYRGYGDSTGSPTEDGVVHDVIKLYELVRSYNDQARIIFYGHSLGCGLVETSYQHKHQYLPKYNMLYLFKESSLMLPNYCPRKTVILTIINGFSFKVILLSLIRLYS